MIKIKWRIVCILFLFLSYLFLDISFASELQLVYEKNFKEITHKHTGFSIIGYREAEFENRLFIKNAFKEVGVTDKQNLCELFELETLFSLEAKETDKKQIKEQFKDRLYQYKVEGETVAECDFTAFSIPELYKDMFRKFLLYEYNLHPQIRRSILAYQKVPRTFNYRFKNNPFSTYYVKYKLKSVNTNEYDNYLIPADYEISFDPENELDVIMHEVIAEQSQVRQLSKEEFLKLFNKAFNQGNYLDANLAILECKLQTGEEIIDQMRKIAPYAETDRQLSLFVRGVYLTNNKETAKKAIESFDAIDRKSLKREHIIDINTADAKMVLGNLDEAKKMFLKVLRLNPYIVGVYKDLGGLFLQSYDTRRAWKCWDTARSLYPDHLMLKEITEYEEWLARKYPEYF